MVDATPAACYAHVSNRKKAGEIFAQILAPRFGDGVDLVLGPGRKAILAATQALGSDISAELPKKGYFFGDSLSAVPATATRAVVLTDDRDFDIDAATQMAIRILSRNKKGFFLMVESDLHTNNIERGLSRAAKFDKLIEATAETMRRNTLVMFTADHSFDLRISGKATRGDALYSTVDGKVVLAKSVTMAGHHAAEQVMVGAEGPGSDRVRGFLSNTDLFHIMMSAYGWSPVQMTEHRTNRTVRP
jgi:alkaline phosphatase